MSKKFTSIHLFRIRLYFKLKTKLHNASHHIKAPTKAKFITKSILEKVLLGNQYYVSGFRVKKEFLFSKNESDKRPKIVVDGQALRNSTFHRGIGRYILSFSRHLAINAPDYDIDIIFTNIGEIGNIPKVAEFFRAEKLENIRIKIFDVMQGDEFVACEEASFRLEKIIETLQPQIVLVPSQFEHPVDCIHLYPTGAFNIGVLIHDLIPITFASDLLPTKELRKRYTKRMLEISEFDQVFSVSNFTANDIRVKLKRKIEVFVINGAGFSKLTLEKKSKLERKKGILTVGAETPHKNIDRLIEAYSSLPINLRDVHKLTIVGLPKESDRLRIKKVADRFGVTVNTPSFLNDDELIGQYRNSKLVVVPSLAEGLSMPVMESWLANTLAIGGFGTVLEEVIGMSDLLFDPYSPKDMAECMRKLLTDEQMWVDLLNSSVARLETYNWDAVARNFLESFHKSDLNHEY